jgi:hypothetical protein
VDLDFAVYGLRLHGAVACIHLQVSVFGHADFYPDISVIASPGKPPMASDAGVDFDMVAILAGFDVQVLVQLVAVVVHDEFDLLGVRRSDADAAVIRVHADIGAARDGVGLGPFLGLGARDDGTYRQQGR